MPRYKDGRFPVRRSVKLSAGMDSTVRRLMDRWGLSYMGVLRYILDKLQVGGNEVSLWIEEAPDPREYEAMKTPPHFRRNRGQ